MNLYFVLIVLFLHWLGDFVIQTDAQTKAKSKSNVALAKHCFTYTATFFIPMALFAAFQNHIGHIQAQEFGLSPWTILFFPITFVAHFITDYFTSRLNASLWKKGNTHSFFVSLGFDQFLHFVQLLLTIKILML